MADTQQTFSVSSLVLVAAIGAVVVRYFFFSPPSDGSGGGGAGSTTSTRQIANPQDVDRIASMFPQIPRRDIMWDLQRNGGNVAGTTERILSMGRLDTPPQSFQPILPASPAPASGASGSAGSSRRDNFDLIKKYNLSEKLKASSDQDAGSTGGSTASSQQNWSQDKQERQEILRRRRDEMILNARRKMEEKNRGSGPG